MVLDRGAVNLYQFSVRPVGSARRLDGQRDIGHKEGAPVGEGSIRVVQLKRGHGILALADRFLHLEAWFPDAVGVILRVLGMLFGDDLGIGHDARVFLRQSDASVMTEPVLGRDSLKRVRAIELVPIVIGLPELAAEAVEVRVARLC